MAKNKNKPAAYGVIGLGRFGSALAKELCLAGEEVIALDCVESKVKEIRAYTEHAFVVQDLSKEVLVEAGIQSCGTVIVCIGEVIDTSILTTLNVVSLGVPRVIAKATSQDQGCVLEKIGAEVVYPESDMAVRLAKKLTTRNVLEFLSLNNEIEISEVRVSERLAGQSVAKANLRKHFHVNIIAIERGEETITDITPEYLFQEGDIVVVIGKKEHIQKLEAHFSGLH